PESERVGPDAISVGMIYRADRLETLAPAQLLEGGTFGTRNRVPLGQAFADRVTGARFVVVSNHLKSKGFCPESGPNTDQGDGQACWNAVRVEGAVETAQWAQGLASEFGTSNVLMVGDFNAYRREDPVRAIMELGFEELVGRHHPGMPLYSYIFRGAAGTLDYAFATPSLASLSEHAVIWNINAAYPWSGRPSEPWLRSSDHDPVVVDLVFSQPATAD
ncbi:MAG: endonuclease, partial [Xanthomonadales bacterium]|nr:endonuclease [Xanthomonadales bacterium]